MRALIAAALGLAVSALAARGDSVTWLPDADGLWMIPANWSGNALPGPMDKVTISVAGDRLITLSNSSQLIRSLVSDERLTISNATLSLMAGAQINNVLTLADGGTVAGGAITLGNGGRIVAENGRIANTTISGDIDIAAGGLTFDSLTLNGAALLSGSGGWLNASSSQTLSGNANLVFQGGGVGVSAGQTLTLPPTVTARPGGAGVSGTFGGAGTLINQGLISADAAGSSLTVNTAVFANQGIAQARNGGTLTLLNNWTNAGTLIVDGDGSTLNLGGK
ncbi:MAG TPA: hypothetical protein VH475_01795, partial [Tepidisphaeraceae bacterium]